MSQKQPFEVIRNIEITSHDSPKLDGKSISFFIGMSINNNNDLTIGDVGGYLKITMNKTQAEDFCNKMRKIIEAMPLTDYDLYTNGTPY